MRALTSRLTQAIEGLTSEEAAFILALGLALGTFPVFGFPTLLCLLAAAVLRLNFPALQLVNQLSSPLQLALLIPFAKLGSLLLGSRTASMCGGAAIDAIAGWICVSIPAAVILYFALAWVLRRQRREWFNKLESPA